MNIISFKNINFYELFQKDDTQRNIGFSEIHNCNLVGRNNYYPNVLIYSNNLLISPYDEKVMSLNKDSFYDNNIYEFNNILTKKNKIIEPVFFFIYNFDNYYHFLYDTLPYLYTYLELKKNIKNLKILVNYPNKYKNEFYKFNIEFLEKFIDLNDVIIHFENNEYKNIYICNSLTHGGYSNNPPRNEVYKLYDNIKIQDSKKTPEYIYISRRTWINSDKSNIGTDYTTRRKMINEDELVERLQQLNFVEIFAENLSTDEKITLFKNAKIIIGSIGGGMANLLFSNKNAKSIIIVTPYFLDINYRFKYSMENCNFTYFYDVKTYLENNKIPLYCRVKLIKNNKIGEIIDFNENKYLINISNNDIAGFNNLIQYEKEWVNENDFILIDNGLNSPYFVDIEKLINVILNLK